jgi:hypothetical protein
MPTRFLEIGSASGSCSHFPVYRLFDHCIRNRYGIDWDLQTIFRVPTSMTTKTHSSRNVAVTVTKKSQATMAWA